MDACFARRSFPTVSQRPASAFVNVRSSRHRPIDLCCRGTRNRNRRVGKWLPSLISQGPLLIRFRYAHGLPVAIRYCSLSCTISFCVTPVLQATAPQPWVAYRLPSIPPPLSSSPVGPHANCCRNRGPGQRYPTCLESVLPSWVFPWLMSTTDHPRPGGQAILHDVLSSSKPRRAATNSP